MSRKMAVNNGRRTSKNRDLSDGRKVFKKKNLSDGKKVVYNQNLMGVNDFKAKSCNEDIALDQKNLKEANITYLYNYLFFCC